MGEEINAAVDIGYYFSLKTSLRIKRKSMRKVILIAKYKEVIVMAAAQKRARIKIILKSPKICWVIQTSRTFIM